MLSPSLAAGSPVSMAATCSASSAVDRASRLSPRTASSCTRSASGAPVRSPATRRAASTKPLRARVVAVLLRIEFARVSCHSRWAVTASSMQPVSISCRSAFRRGRPAHTARKPAVRRSAMMEYSMTSIPRRENVAAEWVPARPRRAVSSRSSGRIRLSAGGQYVSAEPSAGR